VGGDINLNGYTLNLDITDGAAHYVTARFSGDGIVNFNNDDAERFQTIQDYFDIADESNAWILYLCGDATDNYSFSDFTGVININSFVQQQCFDTQPDRYNPNIIINVNQLGFSGITPGITPFEFLPTVNVFNPGLSFHFVCGVEDCLISAPNINLHASTTFMFANLREDEQGHYDIGTVDISGIQDNGFCVNYVIDNFFNQSAAGNDASSNFTGGPNSACVESPASPDPTVPDTDEDILSPSTGTSSASKSVSLSVVSGAISGAVVAIFWLAKRQKSAQKM
jgi:hypothetical protein